MPTRDRGVVTPRPPKKAGANQPFAVAITRARRLSGLTLEEYAAALSQAGAPASRDQVWKWERDEVIVPAYVLATAARLAGQSIAELLGVTDDDQQELRELIRTQGVRLADLEAWLGRLDGEFRELRAAVGQDRPRSRRSPTAQTQAQADEP